MDNIIKLITDLHFLLNYVVPILAMIFITTTIIEYIKKMRTPVVYDDKEDETKEVHAYGRNNGEKTDMAALEIPKELTKRALSKFSLYDSTFEAGERVDINTLWNEPYECIVIGLDPAGGILLYDLNEHAVLKIDIRAITAINKPAF